MNGRKWPLRAACALLVPTIGASCMAATAAPEAKDRAGSQSKAQPMAKAQCQATVGLRSDCNGNGVPDSDDLYYCYSLDCNSNGIPDECDIDTGTSDDCNFNGVPDECEPDQDCNSNSVRDICDIGAGTSLDCNGNGVPDECDIASQTSDDLNSNGVADECDEDCNLNGVPDDIDIANCEWDPSWCSDCNGNGQLDVCELARYVVVDLKRDGLSRSARGSALNDDADVVGTDSIDLGGSCSTQFRAFLWRNHAVDFLPALAPYAGTYTASNPYDINNSTEIVGDSTVNLGAQFVRRPAEWPTPDAVLGLQTPGPLFGGAAYAVNANGIPAGFVVDVSSRSAACVWEAGALVQLARIDPQEDGCAKAVNDAGVIVGFEWLETCNPSNSGDRPLIWASSTAPATYLIPSGQIDFCDDVPVVMPPVGLPTDINNTDVVVGCVMDDAFSWDDGRWTRLCRDGDSCSGPLDYGSLAKAINDDGQIVGYLTNSDISTSAVIWEGRECFRLNELVSLHDAVDINASGCIVANHTSSLVSKNGVYLLMPNEGQLPDCNGNGVPDECDIAGGTSEDCNGDGVPDECNRIIEAVLDPDEFADGQIVSWPTVTITREDQTGPVYARDSALATTGERVFGNASTTWSHNGLKIEFDPPVQSVTIDVASAGEFVTVFLTSPQFARVLEWDLAPAQWQFFKATHVNGISSIVVDTADPNEYIVIDRLSYVREYGMSGPCLGDSNCDGARTWRDIDFLVAAQNTNCAAWYSLYESVYDHPPTCPFENNDVNEDGNVDWRDIDAFVALQNTTCP